MKNPFAWLRILVAIYIIVSLILRYNFGLETFELRWVESGISNWFWAPILIRLVAFFEMTVCVLLLFNATSKKSLSFSLVSLLIFYIFEAIIGASNTVTHAYFYFFFMSPLYSSMALITFSIVSILIALNTKNTPIFALKKRWQLLITTLLCGGVFAMNHISPEDFQLNQTPYEVGVSEWPVFFEEIDKQQPQFRSNTHYLVAFFSTHCEVCHWNAMKMNAALDFYKKENRLLVVFFEPQEDIDYFLTSTNIKAPYITVSPSIVMNLVGDGFPSFCEIKNGKIIRDFSPNEMNYSELHRLFSAE